MATPSREKILKALKSVQDPDRGEDIVSLNMISGLQVSPKGEVIFMIEVDPARGPSLEPLRQKAERCVKKIWGVKKVTAVLTAENQNPPHKGNINQPAPQQRQEQENLLPGVKHVIAVASGKGGVGKSTISVNLAVSLAKNGQKVGLLDADIYGPSQPRMTGLRDKRPHQNEQGKIEPLEAHGIKVMSIGFMVDEKAPLIWRGPKMQGALLQLLGEVNWGELDILLIDMPPGTGDVQLTLAQRANLSGAIIVSTPQDIALLDARKGLEMFKKVDVPVLGIIENMSLYTCPKCGHEDHIFGHGGAKEEAKNLNIPFLGEIPLHRDIRLDSDKGVPIALNDTKAPYAKAFQAMSEQIIKEIM